MAKKSFIILSAVVLIILGFYFYEKYTFEHKLNKKIENLSDYQKNQIGDQVTSMILNADQVKKAASNMGIPTVPINKQEIEDTVLDATTKASDEGIKASMQTYGIPASAEIYFTEYKNYGTSISNNICTSFNLSNNISNINKLSKTPAKCAVDTKFPAQTFTVAVPSLLSNGFYCTDQNGFAGVIGFNSKQFISGIRCK